MANGDEHSQLSLGEYYQSSPSPYDGTSSDSYSPASSSLSPFLDGSSWSLEFPGSPFPLPTLTASSTPYHTLPPLQQQFQQTQHPWSLQSQYHTSSSQLPDSTTSLNSSTQFYEIPIEQQLVIQPGDGTFSTSDRSLNSRGQEIKALQSTIKKATAKRKPPGTESQNNCERCSFAAEAQRFNEESSRGCEKHAEVVKSGVKYCWSSSKKKYTVKEPRLVPVSCECVQNGMSIAEFVSPEEGRFLWDDCVSKIEGHYVRILGGMTVVVNDTEVLVTAPFSIILRTAQQRVLCQLDISTAQLKSKKTKILCCCPPAPPVVLSPHQWQQQEFNRKHAVFEHAPEEVRQTISRTDAPFSMTNFPFMIFGLPSLGFKIKRNKTIKHEVLVRLGDGGGFFFNFNETFIAHRPNEPNTVVAFNGTPKPREEEITKSE